MGRRRRGGLVAACLALGLLGGAAARAQPEGPPAAAGAAPLRIGYLALPARRPVASTFLDPPAADQGLAGARLGLADTATTGRFTGQTFALDERVVEAVEAVPGALRALLAGGARLVVADLPAEALLAAADLPEARDALLLNVSAPDDRLRNADCRRNVLHVAPSRAMLADALMQFLSARRWRALMLLVGPAEADRAYAEAIRRSARKFQLRVAADRPWTYEAGGQRTDTGHLGVAAEAARVTQGTAYDVLVVADEAGGWGDGLEWRTADPRPVAGTQGLVPTMWARPHEQWGATQLQRRFLQAAGRWMDARDHAAWLAVRAVGEAAVRARATDPAEIASRLRGPDFAVAGFKGTRLSFRAWDGQLRQPVLLAGPRALVSVSPQPGFLHQFSELDTLGTDRPETACRFPP